MARSESANDALGDAPARGPRPRIDWTARARSSATDVQRYSRFVVIMKRALPMAAAALLAAVIAYSLQPRQQDIKRLATTFQRLGIVNNDLAMIKPKLTGVDKDGNPFVVTADQAIQDPHDMKRAQLQNVEADMTLKGGNWLNATSTYGHLDAGIQKLWLWGVIDVYSDNGYELHTTAANIDMSRGIVIGGKPANGLGPLGTFRSDRFKIDRKARVIYLYGNVRMTIIRHKTGHS